MKSNDLAISIAMTRGIESAAERAEAAAASAEAVAATIPEDFTELEADVADVKNEIITIGEELSDAKSYFKLFERDFTPFVIPNYYVNAAGKLDANTGYVATDFIPVKGISRVSIKCTLFTNIYFVICDGDKNLLTAIDGSNASDYGYESKTEPQTIDINIPENAEFIRASQRVIYYTQPSDFAVKLITCGLDSKINSVGMDVNGGYDYVIPTVITGKYISRDGSLSENANYNGTDYVSVDGYDSVSINCTIYQGVAFCVYDSAKNVIDFIDGYNCASYGITPATQPQTITYNLTSECKYIRAGVRTIYYIAPSDFNIALKRNGLTSDIDTVFVGTGEQYTSILTALKSTPDNVKLHVKTGTYNIVSEYEDFYGSDFWTNYAGYANSTDYFLRGLWVNNGREIEFESQAVVVFDYSGDNQNVPGYFSVFATGYNATIKNLRCQFNDKCRYAIHDDQGWNSGTNRFENCIFDGTSGFGCTIGGGMGANNTYIIRNCLFINNSGERDLSYHNNGGSTAQNNLLIEGCYGTRACKVYYHGTSTKKTYCMVHGNHFGSIAKEANTQDSSVDNIVLVSWNNDLE